VKHTQEHELTLEWESSSSNDMIADSTLALITSIDSSPASAKCKLIACSLSFNTDSICHTITNTNALLSSDHTSALSFS